MYEAKLQLRLESGEPKCANCAHWTGALLGLHIAVCMRPVGGSMVLPSELPVHTTDLTVCSKWKQKD